MKYLMSAAALLYVGLYPQNAQAGKATAVQSAMTGVKSSGASIRGTRAGSIRTSTRYSSPSVSSARSSGTVSSLSAPSSYAAGRGSFATASVRSSSAAGGGSFATASLRSGQAGQVSKPAVMTSARLNSNAYGSTSVIRNRGVGSIRTYVPSWRASLSAPRKILKNPTTSAGNAYKVTARVRPTITLTKRSNRNLQQLPKTDNQSVIIVDRHGTAVKRDIWAARKDLNRVFKGKATRDTSEVGTIHRNVLGTDGLMDVRFMKGQRNPGRFKGPRIVTRVAGKKNLQVRTNGVRFIRSESKAVREAESHIHLRPLNPKK